MENMFYIYIWRIGSNMDKFVVNEAVLRINFFLAENFVISSSCFATYQSIKSDRYWYYCKILKCARNYIGI